MAGKDYKLTRICELTVLMLALAASLLTCVDFVEADNNTISDHLVSVSEAEHCITGKSKDLIVPEIKINNITAIYDDIAGVFYYTITKPEEIPDAVISVSEGELLIIEQQENDISLSYDVLIISGSIYMPVKLVFTTLPIICFDIETKTGDEYTPAVFRLYDNQTRETTVLTESEGQIKIRGNTSKYYPKKAYRFELLKPDGDTEKIRLLDLRKDDDWLLYAAYNDPEKIRNVFSSNLWYSTCAENNPYGVTAGMEYRFVEMFINNHYEGLYALGYPVDDKQLNNGIEECTGLFKKSGQNVSETHVLLSDEPLPGYEIETKDADEQLLWKTLRQIYYTAGVSNNQSDVWDVINIDSAVDIFLFFNLTQAYDNTYGYSIRNLYFALMGSGQLLYIPWDLDQTWGLCWIGNQVKNFTRAYYLKPSVNRVMMMNPVYRFLKTEEIREKIISRYAYLRAHGWSNESIDRMITYYETQIFTSGAYERDKARWPGGTYIDSGTGSDLSVFRNYVMARLEYMDKYINDLY